MRHRISFRKLSRTHEHRRALLRNLVTSLFLHERIETTVAKAKEARRVAERMITFAKQYDKASPLLKMALFKNTKLDEVKFSARRTIEGETSDYLVVTLKEASVMNYEMHVSPEEPDVIEDRVGFAYKTIVFAYDGGDEMEMDVSVGK